MQEDYLQKNSLQENYHQKDSYQEDSLQGKGVTIKWYASVLFFSNLQARESASTKANRCLLDMMVPAHSTTSSDSDASSKLPKGTFLQL